MLTNIPGESLWIRDTQSTVDQKHLALPRGFLEMQNLGLCLRPADSESQSGTSQSVFNKEILMPVKVLEAQPLTTPGKLLTWEH